MMELLLLGVIAWAVWDKWGGGHIPWHRDDTDPKNAGNDEAVSHILRLMQERGVTLAQLAQAAPAAQGTARPKRDPGEVAMKVFTTLGSIFILGGIGAYISMFWPSMSSFMRIFITLGVGIGLSVFSMVACREGKYPRIILPLILFATLIETGGWFVFVDEVFPHGGDVRRAACFVFIIMALQHWASFAGFRRTSLLFFAVLFTYGFLENALDLLGMHQDYIALLLGASLLFVSDWTAKSRHRSLAGLGYLCGSAWFNGGLYHYTGEHIGWPEAAMATGLLVSSLAYGLKLAGWQRLSTIGFFIGSAVFYCGLFDWTRHSPYELLYLAVAIAMMYGHTVLESGAILVTSTLAILGFIAYYTEEHFVNSVGWPIALILLGVAFFGVSAFALRLRKKH